MQHFHDVVGQVAGGDIININCAARVASRGRIRRLVWPALALAATLIATLAAGTVIAPGVIGGTLPYWTIPAALLPYGACTAWFVRLATRPPAGPPSVPATYTVNPTTAD